MESSPRIEKSGDIFNARLAVCQSFQKILSPNLLQFLSVKLETEGEEATISFLESLGCSDIERVLLQVKTP